MCRSVAFKEERCLHIGVLEDLLCNLAQQLIADYQRTFVVIKIKTIIRLFIGDVFFSKKLFKIIDSRGLATVIIVFLISCGIRHSRRIVYRRICILCKEGIIGFRVNIHLICRDIERGLEFCEFKYVPIGVVFVCNVDVDHVVGKFLQIVDRGSGTEAVFCKETFR